MSTYNDTGFLSPDLERIKKEVEAAYPVHYEYLLKINRFSQSLQYKLNVTKTNPDEIISALLFSRTLSTFQGFILLSQKGMLQQTKMLLRCMLEPLFSLV